MHTIYLHVTKYNDRIFYVGQTNSKKRPYSIKGRSKLWNEFVSKNEYYVVLMHENISKDEANLLESYYVELHGRIGKDQNGTLVNRTKGADGGSNIIYTDVIRKNMSASHVGVKNYMYGKNMSETTKQAVSKAQKGRKRTTEQIEIIRKIHTGRIKSESEIEKIRLSKIGKKRPAHVVKIMSDKMKHAVIAINQCAILEFDSVMSAVAEFKKDRKSLRQYILSGRELNGFKLYYL